MVCLCGEGDTSFTYTIKDINLFQWLTIFDFNTLLLRFSKQSRVLVVTMLTGYQQGYDSENGRQKREQKKIRWEKEWLPDVAASINTYTIVAGL